MGELFFAFLATLVFSVMFNVDRKEVVFCGIVGLLGEGAYLLTLHFFGVTIAMLVASIVVTVLARVLANVRKMPVTVYLPSGIILLVPGVGMYNIVYSVISSDYLTAFYTCVDTLKIAGAIAIGIVLVLSVPNKLFLK